VDPPVGREGHPRPPRRDRAGAGGADRPFARRPPRQEGGPPCLLTSSATPSARARAPVPTRWFAHGWHAWRTARRRVPRTPPTAARCRPTYCLLQISLKNKRKLRRTPPRRRRVDVKTRTHGRWLRPAVRHVPRVRPS